MADILIIFIAAVFAGGLNAVAGGGSFLTFPALVFIGVPVIPANATNAVAVFPGYLSGALGFRHEILAFDRTALVKLLGLAVLGGVAGALLLLVTSPGVFSLIVPWLLLFATLLFAFDAKIKRWIAADANAGTIGKTTATLAVTTYGGYFNGGVGIILLALFSGLGYRDLNLMNGLKSAMSFILSAASVITFAIAGIVVWKAAIVMMIGAVLGGYVGARLARRLPRKLLRAIVITVGLTMTVAFFMST